MPRLAQNVQSWESYFIKVIYYIVLFTFVKSNPLQLHIINNQVVRTIKIVVESDVKNWAYISKSYVIKSYIINYLINPHF